MCGIAGYSLSPRSRAHRTLAAQALLAAIAERGADAAGYAWRGDEPGITIHKQRSGASALLERLSVPRAGREVLVHVRDYTKGHPSIEANNHPIRHGSMVGIHNGIIANDEEIFARHGFERAETDMTVDSEAIFALMEARDSSPEALEELTGSMASAWLDERRSRTMHVARAVGRPLWLGKGRNETFFASTREAIEVVEGTMRMTLTKREVEEGTLLTLVDGRVAATERFTPNRSYSERPLPSVRSPQEGASCLQRLPALAAAAIF